MLGKTNAVQIYTDWANRQLSKAAHRPISNLTAELRDYRVIASILRVVVCDSATSNHFAQQISSTKTNIDGLNTCLQYLQSLGVNCPKVTATDLDTGQLASVLQLLFALSTFKQQKRKEAKAMPPSTSKLPSLHHPQSLATTASPSKLHAPSRITPPKSVSSPLRVSVAPPSPSPVSKAPLRSIPTSATSATTTGIRPPALSGNNNGSISGSSRSSVVSSAYSSIVAPSTPTKPSGIQTPKAPPPKKSQLLPPSTTPKSLAPPTKSIPPPSPAPSPSTGNSQSKMLRLKLFGGKEKDKKDKTPQPSPALERKVVVPAKTPATSGIARPKTTTEVKSRLAPPAKRESVIFRAKPSLEPVTTVISKDIDEKRTSKSSEEDSAYAGFGSTSPASSTQSSISLRSNSSKGSREVMCDDHAPKQPSPRRGSETQDKPTLAVKALTVTRNLKAMEQQEASTSSPEEKKTPSSPTVGVVSPMMAQRKTIAPTPSTSSQAEEKQKPAVPSRGSSRLETTFDSEVTSTQVPSMPPVRHPPSYSQLMKEGRISKTDRVDSSTSEDSLDSVSTTIRLKPHNHQSAVNSLSRGTRTTDSSGYASEGGIAIYEKMQARLREGCREVRRAHFDYGDSFEDSSSLSSGISENFDDVSTDDFSGPDHPMATVAAAYAKGGDYQPFRRTTSASRGGRSSSSSMDARRERENLQQLLEQCRTSQRGAACGSLRSPGYGSSPGYSQLAVSAEGEFHSRSSLRREPSHREQHVPSLAGFHSLDRKGHLSEMSVWDQRSAMALVSPRRIPHQPIDKDPMVCLSSSGMSRSLVMLESSQSPRPRRRASPRARAASPRAPRTRMALTVASPVHSNQGGSLSSRGRCESIYASYRDPMQLHRLADEVHRSPSHCSKDPMGSQVSLASSTAYANLNDKYESDIRKMNRELDGYRQTVSQLTRKHEDYTSLMDMFNQRLSNLGRQIEKAQLRPDEHARLRAEVDQMRVISSRVAQTADARKTLDGAGELLRQPSLESVASVASHRSSMSSSSKSSRTDKTSLNSFGKSKKSWTNVDVQIRSSFTKAFSKKKNKGEGEGSPLHLQTISGSNSRLDQVEVVELKRQLDDRDVALTDVRLDALSMAKEMDVLKETVNKLKNENKQLKQRLHSRSRASSRASLAAGQDDEPLYEFPPSSSQGSSSQGSKRSSGCNSVKVTVNVDLRGTISSAICPDNEIIVGFLPSPSRETSWQEFDQQLYALFDSYIDRVDPDRSLGLESPGSVIGYQIGEVVRQREAEAPAVSPADVVSPTTTVRVFLRGASQQSVDSLVLECLFPRVMLEQLLRFLLAHRRLILSGAAGIGKSNLARQLAAYLAVRIGLSQDSVHDVKIPEEGVDQGIVKVEKQLQGVLCSSSQSVVLIDNIPRQRISFVSAVFSSAQLAHEEGPFVICTVNRASQLPEMQLHNFRIFTLSNRMDGVKGFMGRFLRRRIIEAEFRLSRQTSPDLMKVIQFLPVVLQAVNSFIESAHSADVTVGPRTFLQCPLGVEESREWFIQLWNDNIVPYMEKVAREGKMMGRCGSWDNPTDAVCEHWPWLTGEDLLRSPNTKDMGQYSKQQFNPLDCLVRIESNKNNGGIHNI